jgi:O-antigen ligase
MGQGEVALSGRLGGRDGVAYGAALLFGFSMYASVANLVPALDAVRPALLTSAVAALALVCRRLFHRERLDIDGWRGFCLMALCGMCFGSQAWSVYPAATHDFSVELLKDAAIFFVLANVVTNATRLRWILVVAALGGLAPAWGSFKNYVDGTNLIDGGRARWEGIYLDPNHMAMAMVFLVPVAITMVVRGRMYERVLGAVSLLGSLTAISVSASRGGSLGLLLAAALWAVREKQRARTLSILGLVAVLFLIFSPKSYWNRTQTIADYQVDVAAQGRVHAWEVARAISVDRPLLGVGGGAFLYAWPLYAPVEARHEAFVAHNVLLAMIGELGWVGFFLFLFFVASCLAGAHRATVAPEGGPWVRAIFAGACGYLLCDMSAGYVTSAHFFFIFGLLAGSERILDHELRAVAQLSARAAPPPTLGPADADAEGALG